MPLKVRKEKIDPAGDPKEMEIKSTVCAASSTAKSLEVD